MKILVIGATGMIGSRIVAEALNRGHQVTAASRSGRSDGLPTDPTLTAVALDAAAPSAVAEQPAGHDAVISAVSPPRDGSDPAAPLLGTYRSLVEGLRTAGVRRLIAVGGAGSLKTASGQDRVDNPDFPAIYKAEALAQRDLLNLLRAEATDLDWTYVSPADHIAPGERTGTFRRGGDQLLAATDGSSFISAEDYAVALVDEFETNDNIRRRITVAY
ncbi:NAD(P)-dependent oxidoreductase [Micromonospora sp. KC723]|uniref:NAD(P)-dependent oxidoreductase n=1 Tax=Micromonospora sp. KC723 TaxID=2530381 RepID=UPI00104FDD10|nr:NAD(P)H-binding protein [Micromonospora sp. KC723]TDB74389.1 NAD-dependent epimerase/dehydratase family protein [Micromonospora sp. KC723]